MSFAPSLERDWFFDVIVLDGELAVPSTRNPLQRGRIPTRGLAV